MLFLCCLLLMLRNIIHLLYVDLEFCNFADLLVLIRCVCACIYSLELSKYKISSSLKRDRYSWSLSFCTLLFIFPSSIILCISFNTMLNTSDKNRSPSFVSDLRWKACNLLLLHMILVVKFCRCFLSAWWSSFLFLVSLVVFFNHERVLSFIICSFCTSWDDWCFVFSLFSSFLKV